jgi:hypothetical protein
VKQALLEYFNIGEENLVTVGRGELYPKIPTQAAEAENRRVSVRRITPLLARSTDIEQHDGAPCCRKALRYHPGCLRSRAGAVISAPTFNFP